MRITDIPVTYEDEDKNHHLMFPERVTMEGLEALKREQGSYHYNSQMMLNPTPEEDQVFRLDWLLYWDILPYDLKIIICVDPANTAKRHSDYTAITVHGWDSNQNWYLLDMYRDKLTSESDRWKKLLSLHKKYQTRSKTRIKVLYETIGFQLLDKHYMERQMKATGYKFPIIELAGGKLHQTSKSVRIRAIQPYFESNTFDTGTKIYIPKQAPHFSHYENKKINMVQEFLYEYEFFTPLMTHSHDDIIDTFTFPLYYEKFKNIIGSSEPKAPEEQKGVTYRDIMKGMIQYDTHSIQGGTRSVNEFIPQL